MATKQTGNQKLQAMQERLLVELDGKYTTFSEKLAGVVIMLQKPSMYQPQDVIAVLSHLQSEVEASRSLTSILTATFDK